MNVSTGLTVLIVDDEPPARARLRRLLQERSEVTTLLEAEDGDDAVSTILEKGPDLVFLDVQMPGLDGFEVLQALAAEPAEPEGPARAPSTEAAAGGNTPLPQIVFVTAWDSYALAAFDAGAVDYLLKPFDDERFALCFERAVAAVRAREPNVLGRLLERLESGSFLSSRDRLSPGDEDSPGGEDSPEDRAPLERIPIRQGERIRFLPVDAVDWLEAEDVYVRLHAQGRTWLVRESLSHLEQRLDRRRFRRIHRSIVVNLERIVEICPLLGGRHEIVLAGGTRLRSSRSYRGVISSLTKI